MAHMYMSPTCTRYRDIARLQSLCLPSLHIGFLSTLAPMPPQAYIISALVPKPLASDNNVLEGE